MACQTRVETLEAVDGLDIYCEVHSGPHAKGAILAIHDYGEHCGVYQNLFKRFCAEGYDTYAVDLRGHGKSPGERGLISSFADCLEDLDLLLARMKDRAPSQPIFILGQGLGAVIATSFALSRKPRIKGIILCGLILDLPIPPLERLLIQYLGFVPRRSKALLELQKTLLEPALEGELKGDALAFRGPIQAATVREIAGACAGIQRIHEQLPFSILAIHALDAQLNPASGLERWLDSIAALDKSVLRYAGQDHHILLHKERDQVAGDILEWCDQQAAAPQPSEAVDEWDDDELAHDAL